MNHEQLFHEMQVELSKMERAVHETDEAIAALSVVKTPGAHNAIVGGISMNLHGFYTGVERILSSIATHVDKNLPSGTKWHQDLLIQMSSSVERIRPLVLSADTLAELRAFLAFRHVVRNNYAHALDVEKVLEDASRLTSCFHHFAADCLAFQQSLTDASNSKA
ncbi:hypothetical protein [Leptolyngbya sp. BC1307]|uniref:ribonuclease toxin HepT-like protein n=1 Tax=Leptolyngbya sp. BC1307 TaxID=2029589 RepID=UPI000EFA4F80|nr:hypothetical protein [Leptolyngbya sp. BC1307]